MKQNNLRRVCPVLVFVVAAACGGSTPPVEQTTPEPTVVPPPPPPPESGLAPVAETSDAGTAGESTPKEPKQPDRPLTIYNEPTAPVTVGHDGAVIRLSSAELRIPSGSMGDPRNILFKLESRYKAGKDKIGDVYLIEIQVPERRYQVGEVRASRAYPTAGDNFVLKLPVPQGNDAANLAVETLELDAKNRAKSSWIVVARTKLETADTGNRAVFEMGQLPDAHVHLTTQEPGSN